MRIKTKRRLQLEVQKVDSDGDVFIGTMIGGMYLHRDDIKRFIAALKWALAPAKEGE